MATRFAHQDAARLAGDVFGEILQRNSDPDGYAYVLDCLENGTKSLQQIVVEFITSNEFIDRFVLNQNFSAAANMIRILLLGVPLDSDEERLAAGNELVRVGLRRYAEQIVESEDYQRRIGPDSLPSFHDDASEDQVTEDQSSEDKAA